MEISKNRLYHKHLFSNPANYKDQSKRAYKYAFSFTLSQYGITIKKLLCKLPNSLFIINPYSTQRLQQAIQVIRTTTKFNALSLDLSKLEPTMDLRLQNQIREEFSKFSKIKEFGWTIFSCDYSLQGEYFLPNVLVPKFRSLISLRLDFFKTNILLNEDLTLLGKSIQRMPLLRKFQLLLIQCFFIADLGIEGLCQGLIKKSNLETLRFVFVLQDGITDSGFSKFTESLGKLTNLKNLDFECSFNDIGDQSLINLSNSLPLLPKLERLTLDFIGCLGLTEVGLLALKKYTSKSNALKFITLNFRQCPFIRISICEELQINHTNPDNFRSLEMGGSRKAGIMSALLGYEEKIGYISNLQLAQNLEYFKFNFYREARINQNNLIAVATLVGKLQKLKEFSIQMPINKSLDPKVLLHLAKSLKELEQLRLFTLDIPDSKGVGDDGIVALAESIKYLSNLKSLLLNLSCTNITNRSLNAISKSLEGKCKLNELVLWFASCQHISDSGIVELATKISQLKYLEHLGFDVSYKMSSSRGFWVEKINILKNLFMGEKKGSDRITPKGIARCMRCLESLTSLKKIDLFCRQYTEFDEESFKALMESIGKLKSLRVLELDLDGCKQIDNTYVPYIRDCILKLRNLDHVLLLMIRTQVTIQNMMDMNLGLNPLSSIIIGVENMTLYSDPPLSTPLMETYLYIYFQEQDLGSISV